VKDQKERLVKGHVVHDFVKMIRANPDLPWSEHLLPEDLDLIRQYILPASWYPIGFFNRVGLAVFKLLGKEDHSFIRVYGAAIADQLNEKHPSMVVKGDPRQTLERNIRIHRNSYSYDAFEIEDKGPNHIHVHIFTLPDEVGISVYAEQIAGTDIRLIELSGYPGATVEVTSSEEKGVVKTTLDISWKD
jgi:hypothetical protein